MSSNGKISRAFGIWYSPLSLFPGALTVSCPNQILSKYTTELFANHVKMYLMTTAWLLVITLPLLTSGGWKVLHLWNQVSKPHFPQNLILKNENVHIQESCVDYVFLFRCGSISSTYPVIWSADNLHHPVTLSDSYTALLRLVFGDEMLGLNLFDLKFNWLLDLLSFVSSFIQGTSRFMQKSHCLV